MEKIAAVLVERLGLVAIVGVAAIGLHMYGDLSVSASVAFGVIFTIAGMWIYELGKLANFKPYRLVIGINYDAIWEDLKLVPAEGLCFENVTLTALSAAIFARSDRREYSTGLDIYLDVPCGKPVWHPTAGDIKEVPTFYLRPHRDGYQFGVRVQEEWWKQHSSELVKELRERGLAYDGTLALGLLPYGFIPDHVRKWNETVTVFGGFDRKQRGWRKRLTQGGWAFDEDYPTRIEHRYLVMWYHDI